MNDYPPYHAEACRPDAFLGASVDLPELGTMGCRPFLEHPVTSVEGMIAFGQATDLVGSFYRRWLAREHWGVWQARVLEAVFWRVQDLASPSPQLPHAWGKAFLEPTDGLPAPTAIGLYLDGISSREMERMSMNLLRPEQGKDAFLDWGRDKEWPNVATAEEAQEMQGFEEEALRTTYRKPPGMSLLQSTLAKRQRQELWKPLDAYVVQEAMHAWDAVRFGARRFEVHTLASVGGNWQLAFGKTFGPSAAAALRAGRWDQEWAEGIKGSKPRL